MTKSEVALEEDAVRFDAFLKDNDEKVKEALRKADLEAKCKTDKVRLLSVLSSFFHFPPASRFFLFFFSSLSCLSAILLFPPLLLIPHILGTRALYGQNYYRTSKIMRVSRIIATFQNYCMVGELLQVWGIIASSGNHCKYGE